MLKQALPTYPDFQVLFGSAPGPCLSHRCIDG